MRVDHKVALITGAARGLGKAYAQALLNKGAKVCMVDILEPEGVATVQEFQAKYGSDHVIFIKCDVTDKNQLEAAFAQTVQHFGGLHIVVNNAGVVEAHAQDFQRVIDINVSATIRGTYLAVDHMTREGSSNGGVVVNICSVIGYQTLAGSPAYISSKHAVYGFTKAYAAQLGEGATACGVRLNMLCPAFVKTDMVSGKHDSLGKSQGPLREFFDHHGGWVSKEDMAAALLRLVEEDDHHGAALLVTSGGQEFITPLKHWC